MSDGRARKRLLTGLSSFLLLIFLAFGFQNGWFRPVESQDLILTENLLNPADGLRLHMIDVGQGQAMLLTCNGEAAMVDTGLYATRDTVAEYVRAQGASHLKYVFITHPHSDHCGGAKTVFAKLDVSTLVTYDGADREAALLTAGEWVGASKAEIDFTSAGREYSLGNAKITVLWPAEGEESDNKNELSLVLRVEYSGVTFLLTGDCGQKAERRLVPLGTVNVLQVGHHGSNDATSEALLEDITPDYALISCGKNNDYGHPHQKVLGRLKAADVKVYRTDENGTVVAAVEQGKVKITVQREET